MNPQWTFQDGIDDRATAAWRRLIDAGVKMHLRQRQYVGLGSAASDTLYIVTSGILTHGATLPGRHRQGIGILYPGDMLHTGHLPRLEGTDLLAVRHADVCRIRIGAAGDVMTADPELRKLVDQSSVAMYARLALHVTAIGCLTGPERCASLLVEMATRWGRRSGDSIFIEAALKRTDIAEHLSLNGDTVSRIMTRFRSLGIIAQAGRNCLVVKNWPALCDLTPIAPALTAGSLRSPLAGSAEKAGAPAVRR